VTGSHTHAAEPASRSRKPLLIGALAVVLAAVAAVVVLAWQPWKSSGVDDTKAGGTVNSGKVHDVFGHLFGDAKTVHVDYRSNDANAPATAAADVVIGPPVQARIAITAVKDPSQSGTVIIKDGKTYLTQASFKGQWFIASSADDGVSDTPAFGQTMFELQLLGPKTSAKYDGPETIDGQSTRKYEFSADVNGKATVVATVWIQESGRIVRYSYSPTGDGHFMTATYSKWNEPVTVKAPEKTGVGTGSM
jgi:hypothetical protein